MTHPTIATMGQEPAGPRALARPGVRDDARIRRRAAIAPPRGDVVMTSPLRFGARA